MGSIDRLYKALRPVPSMHIIGDRDPVKRVGGGRVVTVELVGRSVSAGSP